MRTYTWPNIFIAVRRAVYSYESGCKLSVSQQQNRTQLQTITFFPTSKQMHSWSPNSTWLTTLDTTRRVEPMHFGCVELVKQHGSTHSTRRARQARLAT